MLSITTGRGAVLAAAIFLVATASRSATANGTFFVRGDVNVDGAFDISDPVTTLIFLFTEQITVPCLDAADHNDDGRVDVSDPIASLGYQFLAGPPPAAPFPECGPDPTPADAVDCATFALCDQPEPAVLPGDLVITEIMKNPGAVSDSAGEWFEVLNVTDRPLDLNGLLLRDNDIDTHAIASDVPILVPAGDFAVLGNNADGATNGGVGVDYQYADVFLGNGDDEVVLENIAGEVIDSVAYTDAAFPDTPGVSMQLDGDLDPVTIDNNDGANWCNSRTPIVAADGDLGTPGAANTACDVTAVEVTIYAIQDATDPDHVDPGATVRVRNVVVTVATGGFLWVQEQAGGMFSGIFVDERGLDISGLQVGDLVDVEGTYVEPFSLSTIEASSITPVGTIDPPTAALVTPDDLDDPDVAESWESVLVRVENVTVTDANPDAPSDFGEFVVDGVLRVNDLLHAIEPDPQVGTSFASLTGVVNFGFGNFKLEPRSADDVEATVAAEIQPGDLVITEIMNNPSAVGDSSGEWVEIANVTTSALNLDGVVLRDDGTDTHTITGPVLVQPGGRVLLGNNADAATNGGVAVDYQYAGFFLGNGADEVVLESGGVIIDSVAYDGGLAFPDPTGASMQLDPAATTATDNDDGANWCTSRSMFGAGDLGTPGSPNEPCDVAPTGLTIYAIQDETDPDHPGVGSTVTVQSVLVTVAAGRFVWVQESAGGPFSGIAVDASGLDTSTLQVGDVVDVTGVYVESFGLSTIDASAITLAGPGSAPAPATLAVADLADPAVAETWESVLVRVENVTVTDANPDAPSDFGEFVVDNVLRVDDLLHAIAPDPQLGDSFASLTGVLNFSFGNYKLEPRSADDVDAVVFSGIEPGDLVITEIMNNPSAVGDNVGEWFEVVNVSAGPLDLDRLVIRDDGVDTHTITGAVVVPAGGFVLLGNNADAATNGGVAVDYQYTGFFLGNGADEVVLESGGVIIDSVAYDGGVAFPDLTGASMQLDPAATTATDNDNPVNWCASTTAFGAGDLGTPGAVNESCP